MVSNVTTLDADDMEDGYIMLSRKFFEHKIWKTARTFNESEAWLDLIQSARFEPSVTTSRVGVCKKEITWGRGQYPASIRFLAKKWNWNIRKVKSFLTSLKCEDMISVDDAQGITVITLLNFDKYNYTPTSNEVNVTANVTDKYLSYKDLDVFAEQVAEHLAKKRNASVTKNNKDNNILSSTPQRAYTRACEADFFAELRISQIWLEDMCMRFHLPQSTIVGYINEFELECKCKDHIPESISDLKSHFHDWLRIQQQKKQNQNQNERTANNQNGLSERLRSKLHPAPGCGLIED